MLLRFIGLAKGRQGRPPSHRGGGCFVLRVLDPEPPASLTSELASCSFPASGPRPGVVGQGLPSCQLSNTFGSTRSPESNPSA